jgi:hypothetical protein
MTRKKAMQDAKAHYALQIDNDLNAMQIEIDSEEQQNDKVKKMELFINSMQGELSEQEEEEPTDELTQSELEQLTGSLSDCQVTVTMIGRD